ncbi:hypothetical protein GCM10011376_06710 [Nocardioides flavus (ex Wang et al. 2016)]|uniref:Signal peptidase II n=1 Tax=Nocardioides flavus (ex Wang et al. 2016) TaxID=2058780 RepID=A0ABQ3HEP5_9ACTN|nr:signal peptidase II [Nocardioides flavus (ex Wang et al. 2016)]GHE15973.1 hypothetical protein GCM10011376_06710 [Nocardioides flavus (ex Wang et al. 2016)]
MGRGNGRWIRGPDTAGRESAAPVRHPSRQLAAVVGATVVIDQVSKAIAWRGSGSATLNPGSEVIAPWLDATSRSSLGGAPLDLAGVLVLTTAAVLTVRRCRDRLLWWAAALNIAGWTSNLLDRLGLHWLTAPGSRRGTVDWLQGYNLADLTIWAGCALALAWLAREVLRDVGWDLRQPRQRVAAGVVVSVVTGLALAGMASTDGRMSPSTESPPERTTASECRDPAFALAPINRLLCADEPAAARPVEVTSAVACPAEDTAIVHVTVTNPNRGRRARFSLAASGPFRVAGATATHGQVEAGGTIDLRLVVRRRAAPTLLYLETAVQVWEAHGTDWVPGSGRLWSTDACSASWSGVRSAQVTFLCSPSGVAHVALAPRPLSDVDEPQPVVLTWSSPMKVVVAPREGRPRRAGLTIDLADRSLSVARVTPRTVSDVLTVTGWGPGTIDHGYRSARSVRLPVGRCLQPDGPSTFR